MIGVTVQSDVSLGRRIYRPSASEVLNLHFYGSEMSPRGIGHNMTFQATFVGEVDPQSGMIHPYDDLKSRLKQAVGELDHQLLNETVATFRETSPTLENLCVFVFDKLKSDLPGFLKLKRMRAYEGPKMWADVFDPPFIHLTKEWLVRCIHRHHNPELSIEENQSLYNKCAATHGHEYRVQVTLRGPIDPEWGVVGPRAEWEEIVQEAIVKPFDGQFLNDHIGNTSGEIIAAKFFEILKGRLPRLLTVSVRETRKNSFFAIPTPESQRFIAELF